MSGPSWIQILIVNICLLFTCLGFILAEDLVDLLLTKGEPLTQQDVDNLLCEIEIDGDDKVNIIDFIEHMFSTSAPEALPLVETYQIQTQEIQEVEA